MARIVLDASVLIALHDPKDAHHAWAAELLTSTLDDSWAMNAVTLAEVLVRPQRQNRADIFLSNVKGLGIEVIPLDADSSVELAKLRATHNLPMPDTIVLQSAIAGSSSLATCDARLARTARSLGATVHSPTA
jgi:predicted nucleic acid-binding protein